MKVTFSTILLKSFVLISIYIDHAWYTKKERKKKEKSGRLEDEKDHLPFEYLINKLYLLPQHEQMLALVESLS